MPTSKQPKYNFGVLETPGTTDFPNETSDSNGSTSGLSTSKPGTSAQRTSSRLSSGPNNYSTLTSGGSLSSTSDKRCKYGSAFDSRSSFTATPLSSRTPRADSVSSRTPGSRRTPRAGSCTTPMTATPAVNNCSTLAALVEGRGLARGEVGMATLDLKKPELVLSQFSDMSTYVKTTTKLQIVQPLEIVLPSTACESATMTSLSKLLADQFPNTSISTVHRKYFNETKGLLNVKQLCVPEYRSVELEVSTKYYCLAAAAALIKYLEFIQNIVYAPASIKVVFQGSENTTMIDVGTARNLELLQNQRDLRSDHTLYGILNYTKTAGGARLLRSNILQPPCGN